MSPKSRKNDSENESSSSEEDNWKETCENVLDLLLTKGGRWEDLTDSQNRALLHRTIADDGQTQTPLHIVADKFKKNKYCDADEVTLNTVIKYLVENYSRPSYPPPQEKGFKRETPFLMVALKKNSRKVDRFIDCVMKCSPSEKFAELLNEQDDEGRNSLHQIFFVPSEKHGSRRIRKRLVLDRACKYVEKANSETIAAQDRDGNTPIHYALHYLQSQGRCDRYIEVFKDMVNRGDKCIKRHSGEFNAKRESPLQYHNRTKEEEEDKDQKGKDQAKAEIQDPPKQPGYAKQQMPFKPNGTLTDLKNLKIQARLEGLPREWENEDSMEIGDKDDTAKSAEYDHKNYKTTIKRERNSQAPQSPIAWTNGGDKAATDREIPEDPCYPPTEGALPNRGIRRTSTTNGLRKAPASEIRDELATNSHITPQGSIQNYMGMPLGCSNTHSVDASIERMLEFLKLHYIRTRSDLQARELIYGNNSNAPDKQFYFDASELDPKDLGPETIVDLVEKISLGGFHSTLSYVGLPTVAHIKPPANNKKAYGSQRKEENPKTGRTSLLSVFDSLRKKGVEKILRLNVEDMEEPSHTDEAIIRALRGDRTQSDWKSRPISVETWDWRKPDLSTDVIRDACPTAEVVKLYWSGNHMVLKGWGCMDGIPKLYRSGSLKHVIIFASPGIETRDRMERTLRDFESGIKEFTDGLLKVEIIHLISGLRPCLDLKAETSASARNMVSHQQHRWVEEMDQFMVTLKQHVHPQLLNMNIKGPQRVKVALIDDGVDLSKLEYYDKTIQITGRSYCGLTDGFESPWYSSASGHGTIMANMILRINPWISLHVLKLPVTSSMSRNGGFRFNPQGVANAIKGAVDLKVDIIIMAWTMKSLDKSHPRTQGKINIPDGKSSSPGDMIKKAIEKAKEEKILMFCSASDDITRNSKDFFPYVAVDDENVMFRIGAADALGQRDPRTEDTAHIDYFFPGNQVAERLNPRSGAASEVKLHDGASIGTALAAGLASLIIHCTRIVHSYWEAKGNPSEAEIYRERASALKEMGKMRTALDHIYTRYVDDTKWREEKYLPVWGIFGKARSDIENAYDSSKLEKLQSMVANLTYDLIVR